jgi:soluble lytic murein transglycosylase
LAYPLAFGDLVEREATANGLDPYLLLSLLRQESWFGPAARSGAEALGLSQVIPPTAAEIAQALGRRGFNYEDLVRPKESVAFGSWYLAKQSQTLGRRPLLALAAYNAGPGSAQRWTGGNPRVDPDDFVQAIDFTETRNYVRSIYEIYGRYRELYG